MNTAKSLDEEITRYLPNLNTRQKETVLTVVKAFAEEQKDWWDEIDEEMQQAIDKALAEANEGKVTPHEEVMKDYSKWLENLEEPNIKLRHS